MGDIGPERRRFEVLPVRAPGHGARLDTVPNPEPEPVPDPGPMPQPEPVPQPPSARD